MSTQSEAEFFDNAYDTNLRNAVGYIYAITKSREEKDRKIILESIRGKRVLEYGCGTGWFCFELAKAGAEVVGIDISPVAVEKATEKAVEAGLDNTSFHVMDAENMDFGDNEFDMICGVGIIHPLDVKNSLKEVARVLNPTGTANFMEPLGHNLIFTAFRNVTPKLCTPDEHPLLKRDFELAKKYFSDVDWEFYHLTSFLALLFLKFPNFWSCVDFLERVDRNLF